CSSCRCSLGLFSLLILPPPSSTLFPYTRSSDLSLTVRAPSAQAMSEYVPSSSEDSAVTVPVADDEWPGLRRGTERRPTGSRSPRSEEHTSELQSPYDLVCRLLLEKKKINIDMEP